MKYKYQTEQEAICTTCEENRKVLYEYDGLKKTCPRCLLVHLSCDFDINKIKGLKFLTTDILLDRISETSTKKITSLQIKNMVNNVWYQNSMDKRYENTKIIQIFEIVNQMITKLYGKKFNLIGCKFCQDVQRKTLHIEKLPCCNVFICYACLGAMDRSNRKCKNCEAKLYESIQHFKKVMCNLATYALQYCDIVPTPEIQKEVERQVADNLSKKNKRELKKITIEEIVQTVVCDICRKMNEKCEKIKRYKSKDKNWERIIVLTQHIILFVFKSHALFPDLCFINFNRFFSNKFVERVIMPIEKIESEYNCVLPKEAHQIQRAMKTMLLCGCFLIRFYLQNDLEDEYFITMSIFFRFLIILITNFSIYFITPITASFKNRFVKK